jgi:hypothetical protein
MLRTELRSGNCQVRHDAAVLLAADFREAPNLNGQNAKKKRAIAKLPSRGSRGRGSPLSLREGIKVRVPRLRVMIGRCLWPLKFA